MTKQKVNQARFEILELNVQDPITFQKDKKTENNENTQNNAYSTVFKLA
jgi:hypothetical protein